MRHYLITSGLLAVFLIMNWLMDIFGNFERATNGIFDNFFNLNIDVSYHIVWYLAIIAFATQHLYCHYLFSKVNG